MEQEFTLILPSNSSEHLFQNKLSDYHTQLKDPIYLNGSWEVSLLEAHLPTKFKYSVTTTSNDSVFVLTKDGLKKVDIETDTFESLLSLTAYINRIVNYIIPNNYKEDRPTFNYNDLTKKFYIVNPGPVALYLSNSLCDLFGFSSDMTSNQSALIEATFPIEIFQKPTILFFYTNIVEHSHVGHSLNPILGLCSLGEKPENEQITITFNREKYFPLNTHMLSTIHIQIADSTGQLIKFASGESRVVLVLHFRKRL